jgi:hypothetical protein
MEPREAMMHGRWLVIALLTATLGCDDSPRRPPAALPSLDGPHHFEAATAGTVTGRVVWIGGLPEVPPLIERPAPTPPFTHENVRWPNPNAPAIDPATRGVKGAVVFLRGIDASRGRPWDQPPAQVVQQGQQFHIRQGESDGTVGFVRQGDAVAMASDDPMFHSLHAGGAAFFTLAFPDRGRTCTRRLSDRGVVELTSAAGYFWMRGYLFVDDHPYYARSDAEGRFRLEQVPPGSYDVVCWMPDWHEERHERDPETCLITRLVFRPPLLAARPVEVVPQGSGVVEFEMKAP